MNASATNILGGQNSTTDKKLRIVKINTILPSPHQTRIFPEGWTKNESTQEMMQSIKENGLFQPPLVRIDKKHIGKYVLVAGERRLRCSKLAGLKEIPIIVIDMSEKEAASVGRRRCNLIKMMNSYLDGKVATGVR